MSIGAMTALSLSSNQIGDTGATALAEGLKHNGALKTLYLRNTKIGDKGGKALGKALESNSKSPSSFPEHVPLTTYCS